MDGVSCMLCHQIIPANLGTDLSFTGQYVIDTTTVSPERLIFGPHGNPLRNPMQRNTGFLPRHYNPGKQLADPAPKDLCFIACCRNNAQGCNICCINCCATFVENKIYFKFSILNKN